MQPLHELKEACSQSVARTARGTASLHDGEEAMPWPALAPALGPAG